MDAATLRMLSALLGGFLWSVGWWLVIDAGAYARHTHDAQQIKGEFVVPPIIATFALLLINSFKWEDFQGTGFSEHNHKRAKCCFFMGLVLLMLCVMGSLWVLIEVYTGDKSTADSMWPGLALFLNVIFTLFAAFLMRAGRMQSA